MDVLPSDIQELIERYVKEDLYIEYMAGKVKHNKDFIQICSWIEEDIRNFFWFLLEEDLEFSLMSIFVFFNQPLMKEEMLISNLFSANVIFGFFKVEIFHHLTDNKSNNINLSYITPFYFLLHCVIDNVCLPYAYFSTFCFDHHLSVIDRFVDSIGKYHSFMSYCTADINLVLSNIVELIAQDMNVYDFDNTYDIDIERIVSDWFKYYLSVHLLIPYDYVNSDTKEELIHRQFIHAAICSNVIEYWYGWYYLDSIRDS